MENITSNVMKYLLKEYPHKDELSASRLTKMIYLMDWKSAIDNGSQITNVVWHFDHYGPYDHDVVKIAKEDKYIDIENTSNYYGGIKQLFKLSSEFDGGIEITGVQKKIADFVIFATKDKSYDAFIRLVYSTYPVISSKRCSDLSLVDMAKKYKDIIAMNCNK